MARIGRDDLNMQIAGLMAQRSTCSRKKTGCVITQGGRIVSTGYNGAPSGLPHCDDQGGCETGPDGGCITTSHAEAGAIAFAARKGLRLEGSVLYVTLSPCLACAKLIIIAGITKVLFKESYRDLSGIDLLRRAGIEVIQFGKN